jgi:hypothetical protein
MFERFDSVRQVREAAECLEAFGNQTYQFYKTISRWVTAPVDAKPFKLSYGKENFTAERAEFFHQRAKEMLAESDRLNEYLASLNKAA